MSGRQPHFSCPGSCVLMILALLEDGDKCGLQLLRALHRREGRAPMLTESALYPILHSMEANGDIHSYEREGGAGRPRRFYQLTHQGNCTLNRRRREWEHLCRCFGTPVGGERCDRK